MSAADWQAKWIRPAGPADPDREPVGLLRRSFSTTKKISRARLYATARGLFELQLNGKRVGNNPGYKHFFVRPLYLKQLDHAAATLVSPYGKISSRWIRTNGKVAVEIVVPANTTATIELPGREPQTVAAGEYHFDPVEAQR
ncbi:MAG TPA: alpha-L-rhamnosidase C-terminal domain-containing protein [Steroidobacter sp.]